MRRVERKVGSRSGVPAVDVHVAIECKGEHSTVGVALTQSLLAGDAGDSGVIQEMQTDKQEVSVLPLARLQA